jgi:hypothetical protein
MRLKGTLILAGIVLFGFCTIFAKWPLRGPSNQASLDSTAEALLWIIGAVAYLIPIIIAGVRNCKSTAAIVIIDLLLGWTFVGWVVALSWAASGERKLSS